MNSIICVFVYLLGNLSPVSALPKLPSVIKQLELVHFLGRRYDGDIHSLADRSHKPHHHPKQHTDIERKWIKDLHRRNTI